MDGIDLFIFCSFLTLLVCIGLFRSRSVNSESAYLFARRKTKWIALTATLVMTEFNSATLISFSSMGYAAGFWALILPLVFLIGLLFYALSVAKKWKTFDGISVAGFFTKRYGPGLGKCASFFLLFAMTGFSAIYVRSLTMLFQPLFPMLHGWTISFVLLSIIFVMSLRGGLISIIRTDLFALICLLIFFPAMAIWMGRGEITSMDIVGREVLPIHFVFSLIILTMFTYILAPWYGQKIFAAQSTKTAFWSVVASAFLVFLLYGSAIVATAFFRYRGYHVDSIEEALPALVHTCLPKGLRGLAYALFFSTSATTLTGVWNAMAAMWVGDFQKKEEVTCNRSISATFYFALTSFFLANLLFEKIFDSLILLNVPIAALSFGLLAGFYWKRASSFGALLSVIMGCIVGILPYLLFKEADRSLWYWTVYGLPLIFLTGIIGSLARKSKVS
ncbi:MAG: hypothetical protein S4CHLAM45_02300 [Chlamydiales bacterium]|nr:hypothetical protein [Chlamydiales bacterium]MCH9619089.1 hypothetical protein [Chlamydiales bacterium]MCH9622351.1 hypothetical protein [Chlamydiales bacterium]